MNQALFKKENGKLIVLNNNSRSSESVEINKFF